MIRTVIDKEIDKLTTDKKITNEILDVNKKQFANYMLTFGGKQMEDTISNKISNSPKKESWLKRILLKIADKL